MKRQDLTIYFVLTGLAIIHFLLKTKNTVMEEVTWVFTLMWVIAFGLLVWLKVTKQQGKDVVDWEANLEKQHLLIVLGAVAGMLVTSTIVVSAYWASLHEKSVLWIPRPSQVLGELSLVSELTDDLLYNFVLVAPAEECMKLAGVLAIYRFSRNEFVSVGLPVGFWAVLHSYQAYLGPLQAILVISAFLSGLFLYVVLRTTKSLENAIVSHAIYNGIIVLLAYV